MNSHFKLCPWGRLKSGSHHSQSDPRAMPVDDARGDASSPAAAHRAECDAESGSLHRQGSSLGSRSVRMFPLRTFQVEEDDAEFPNVSTSNSCHMWQVPSTSSSAMRRYSRLSCSRRGMYSPQRMNRDDPRFSFIRAYPGQDEEGCCCQGPEGAERCCGRKCVIWDRIQEHCAPTINEIHSPHSGRPPLFDCGETCTAVDRDGKCIDAYTQGLVVVKRQNIPLNVFKRIDFANRDKHSRLVTEVEYDKKDGDIYYDIESQDNVLEDGYARLITLNWWYTQLFMTLILACMAILNFFSNVLFSVSLFVEGHLRVTVPLTTRTIFVIVFVLTECVICRKCYIAVNKERLRKADPTKQGDLITGSSLNAIDNLATWVAMFCFKFIHVDTIVRDMVIYLHPWKSIQPYGAFKADGHRAYLIGWASEYMFRCENKAGQEDLLGIHMFLVGVVTTFKINVIVESGTLAVAPLILLLPSLVNLVVVAVKQWHLINDRRKYWWWLCYEQDHLKEVPDNRKAKALARQKSQHFPEVSWSTSLDERRTYFIRTTLSVLIPAILGVVMHLYDDSRIHARWSQVEASIVQMNLPAECRNLSSLLS